MLYICQEVGRQMEQVRAQEGKKAVSQAAEPTTLNET